MADRGLNTVSLRLRVTVAVIAVLGLVLIAVGAVVDAVFAAQSQRNLDTLLTGSVQLARQLARSGVRPQALVRRVSADGVQAHLVLRTGDQFGVAVPASEQVRTVETRLSGPGRLAGARLVLAVDTSLLAGARQTLRQVLLLAGSTALLVSAGLVTLAVRAALQPLGQMAQLASTIASGHRGSRLSPTKPGTELGRTAAAFDAMLDELEGAEARARDAEQRTRAFLADAAHELRTPISGVSAAAETLLQHGSQLSAADRERLELLLLREARRAGALVSDLLTTARLDAGVDLERAPVSLRQLCAAEVDRIRLLHPSMAVHFDGDDVVLAADHDQVGAIIRNLLDNAARAAGPHGAIEVTLGSTPDAAVVELSDSGPGIPPSDRERIFDRLVRLDRARSSDSGGAGLGLAIARGFARAHGGDLACEDPGEAGGARFRLVLPRDAGDLGAAGGQ